MQSLVSYEVEHNYDFMIWTRLERQQIDMAFYFIIRKCNISLINNQTSSIRLPKYTDFSFSAHPDSKAKNHGPQL